MTVVSLFTINKDLTPEFYSLLLLQLLYEGLGPGSHQKPYVLQSKGTALGTRELNEQQGNLGTQQSSKTERRWSMAQVITAGWESSQFLSRKEGLLQSQKGFKSS